VRDALYDCETIIEACHHAWMTGHWNGPDLPPEVAHIVPPLAQQFSDPGIADALERGGSLLHMALLAAFQFGYANGIRKGRQESAVYRKIAELVEVGSK